MINYLLGNSSTIEFRRSTINFDGVSQDWFSNKIMSYDGKGFKCVVVLPQGTNYDLKMPAGTDGEDKLLNATNKWLIAHKDANIQGAFTGLKGENLSV